VRDAAQKQPGTDGFVVPVKDEQHEPMTIDAMILEMGTGSPNTPKGGLKELVEATGKGEILEMPGKFGKGAYKDEPFGIVAIRKRVYAMRAFYEINLPVR
jgi:hypothetical protein